MNVGPYTVVEELGKGGMGRVRLARDPGGALVVLKDALHDHADDHERLRDEARVGLRLRHKNIVETVDCLDHDGRPVLVTRYVAGVTLLQLRGRGPLSPVAVCAVGRQLASALDAIHSCSDEQGRPLGVLHRDVTGGNAIVDDAGCVRLIDLGIARSFESRAMRTQTGMLRGTLRYLAPELFDGGSQSPQSDLWALGIVLWEALLGRPAVIGGDVIAMARVCSGSVMALEPGEAPHPMVHKAIARLLMKDPSARPRSARDAAALFTMVERQLGGDAALDLGNAVVGVMRARGAQHNTRAAVGLVDDTPMPAQPPTAPWPELTADISLSTMPKPAPTPAPMQSPFDTSPLTPSKSLLDFAARLSQMERSLGLMWGYSEQHTQELVRHLPVVKGQILDGTASSFNDGNRAAGDTGVDTDVVAVGGELADFFDDDGAGDADDGVALADFLVVDDATRFSAPTVAMAGKGSSASAERTAAFPPPPSRDERTAAYPPPPSRDERTAAYPPPPSRDERTAAYPPPPSRDERTAAYPPPPPSDDDDDDDHDSTRGGGERRANKSPTEIEFRVPHSRIPTPAIWHQAPEQTRPGEGAPFAVKAPGTATGLAGFPSVLPLPPHTPVYLPLTFARGALDAQDAMPPLLTVADDEVTTPTGAAALAPQVDEELVAIAVGRPRQAATVVLVVVVVAALVATLWLMAGRMGLHP